MTDDLSACLGAPFAAARPLLGLTVLLVEDSRFASEAMRLLCLRSGARIRRADTLRAAQRHLATYRPTAVIVDMGLPDGSGGDLIALLASRQPRVPVLLAISGDPDRAAEAMAAGADGFLEKPIESVAAFQQALLSRLPPGDGAMDMRLAASEANRRPRPARDTAAADPPGPGRPPASDPAQDRIAPDPIALRDDLAHAAELLAPAEAGALPDAEALGYVAHFLKGLASISHDAALAEAAQRLQRQSPAARQARPQGRGGEDPAPPDLAQDLAGIQHLLKDRLALRDAI